MQGHSLKERHKWTEGGSSPTESDLLGVEPPFKMTGGARVAGVGEGLNDKGLPEATAALFTCCKGPV